MHKKGASDLRFRMGVFRVAVGGSVQVCMHALFVSECCSLCADTRESQRRITVGQLKA
jgi:hypothetical protein